LPDDFLVVTWEEKKLLEQEVDNEAENKRLIWLKKASKISNIVLIALHIAFLGLDFIVMSGRCQRDFKGFVSFNLVSLLFLITISIIFIVASMSSGGAQALMIFAVFAQILFQIIAFLRGIIEIKESKDCGIYMVIVLCMSIYHVAFFLFLSVFFCGFAYKIRNLEQ